MAALQPQQPSEPEASPGSLGLWQPRQDPTLSSRGRAKSHQRLSDKRQKALPARIKEEGKCKRRMGMCSAEIASGSPRSCVGDIRSIFPNRTEVWGWLSFCSSKQLFSSSPSAGITSMLSVTTSMLRATCQPSSTQSGEGDGTARNADGISPGLGQEQRSLQIGNRADSSAEDHSPKPPYLDRSERVGRQHLSVPPLSPNLQAQLLPSHSPQWPVLFLSSITSSPIAHSTFSASPARGSPPDKFIITLPPPPQRCRLIRWFVI